MSANVWSPNTNFVTQANANGTVKTEEKLASLNQRSFTLNTFAYAVNTGSLLVFKDGAILTRGTDYVEVNSTEVLLTEAVPFGSKVLFVGFIGITGIELVDSILRNDLFSSGGAGFSGFSQGVLGSALLTVQDVLREQVSVKRFGAVGDGSTDDTAAIQAAIEYCGTGLVKELLFPAGVYFITNTLTIPNTASGIHLRGQTCDGVYISTPNGSVFDLLRVGASYANIAGIQFRPGGNQPCMRVYAAHCTIINNRLLADVNNVGIGIILTDINPVGGAFVAGAYTHNIINNIIGVAGFAFATGIDDGTTMGLQATKFLYNQIYSNTPIRITTGGGNTTAFNLLQSSTGTTGVPAGNGIDIGANVAGEMVFGNYIERFAVGILIRQLSNVNRVLEQNNNHFDNCTATVTSLGAYNYKSDNHINNTAFINGWTQDFSNAVYSGVRTLTGTFAYGADSNANFVAGITSSSSHHIKKVGAQGTVILQVDGGVRGSYFQTVDGAGGNGANAALNIGGNSVTLRSINAGGTVNASGADFAEYMSKADNCGIIAKGAIVGINNKGKLTDKWAESIAFCIKSTEPSYVGGDNWATHLGERPLNDEAALVTYEAALEVARQKVDRIAFVGQAPVNVLGATPGQLIIPVQDGVGIKGMAVANTAANAFNAVGKVIAIELDGRAKVIVKIL